MKKRTLILLLLCLLLTSCGADDTVEITLGDIVITTDELPRTETVSDTESVTSTAETTKTPKYDVGTLPQFEGMQLKTVTHDGITYRLYDKYSGPLVGIASENERVELLAYIPHDVYEGETYSCDEIQVGGEAYGFFDTYDIKLPNCRELSISEGYTSLSITASRFDQPRV